MSNGSTATNHAQPEPAGPSDVLRASVYSVFFAAIGLSVAAGLYWMLDIGPDIVAFYIGICITAILGLVLGYRAQSLAVRPLSAAFGVSWRIGFIWVMVAAIVEFAVTDFTASLTVNTFPVILLPTVAVVVPTLLIGYVMGIIRHEATWQVIRRDVVPIVGTLLAVAGLVLQLLGRDPDPTPKNVQPTFERSIEE